MPRARCWNGSGILRAGGERLVAQGTIKTYDVTSKSGVILDDARQELAFDADSFRHSGIRMFRIGQRVKYQVAGHGDKTQVRELTIVTF
jgi:cold shock CspA family protein